MDHDGCPDGNRLGDTKQQREFPIIAALWLAETSGAFETSMIYAAQRALTEDIGDPARVGWLITAYMVIGGGAAAIVGRTGDIFGRRRLLMVLLVIAAAGSLISAVATSYIVLLIGRCLQGITGAILPLCIGLISEKLPPARVSIGIGFMISGASAGAAAGLVLGGVIVDYFSWNMVFLASLLLSTMSCVLVWLFVTPSPTNRDGQRADWASGVLFVPGILGLLISVTYGPQWGWLSSRSIGFVGVSLGFIVVWIVASLRSSNPLFDIRLFWLRAVWVPNLVSAILALTVLQITLVFSLLLQAPTWTMIGHGTSDTVAGLVKMPSNISSLAGGPLSGWLTARRGGRLSMVAGGLIAGCGWVLAIYIHSTIWEVMAVLVVISFGTAMLYAVAPTVLAVSVPASRTAEAVGIFSVTRQVFMGIGAQLISIILASSTVQAPDGGAHYPSPAAFTLTMWIMFGGALLSSVLSLALPKEAARA